jgi:dihydropteroate synthase
VTRAPSTVPARLAAIDRLVREHAAKEAAQLADEGWELALIRETVRGGLADYLAARIRHALAAGVADWECSDSSRRFSALEQRLDSLERVVQEARRPARKPLGDSPKRVVGS